MIAFTRLFTGPHITTAPLLSPRSLPLDCVAADNEIAHLSLANIGSCAGLPPSIVSFVPSTFGMPQWSSNANTCIPIAEPEDAAQLHRSVGADREPMFGFLFGVVAVQANFDHNIFANMPTAYFHHGVPLAGTSLNVEELERIRPSTWLPIARIHS